MTERALTVNEQNPLVPIDLSKPRQSETNKSGRPTKDNLIKFGPQPKSIVSQMLKQFKETGSTLSFNTYNRRVEKRSAIESCDTHSSSTRNKLELEPDVDVAKITNNKRKDSKNISYPCDFPNCKYVCKFSSSLVKHKLTHSSEKSYQGNVDVAKVANDRKDNRNLTYSCDFPNCKYVCRFSSNLVKHKRTHTSEKQYLCHLCSFRSNFVNSFKVHQRLHTAEKPFGCNYCDYRCNSSSNLKKHCKHRHNSNLKT